MKSTSKLLINTLRMRDKTPPHPSTRTIIAVALAFATLVALLAYSPNATGAAASFSTKVLQTMVDAEKYAGCMVKVQNIPPQLDCRQDTKGTGWVTMSCNGLFTSPPIAREAFKQAQMALLTGNTMAMWLDDNETTEEGFCHAYRSILSN